MTEIFEKEAVSAGVSICSCLADLGLDVAKNHIQGKIDENKLKLSLKEFIERYRKYNELCSLAEEIDFEGLLIYIENNLLDDVSKRIFSPSAIERGQARQEIIDKSISYAQAKTEESQKRVEKIICIALDIIKAFYKNKVSYKEWIIAASIADGVAEQINSAKEDIVNKLDSLKNEIVQPSPVSLDMFYQLSSQGDINAINKNLKLINNVISTNHPLYPDYGYELYGENLKSVALTPYGAKKYPENYIIRGNPIMGNEKIDNLDKKMIEYADRHQLTISVKIDDAEKLLGTVHDPDQSDAKKMIGKVMIRKPKAFPKAFPCAIKLDNEIIYEYIELRTAEIMDDGMYIIDNREQNNCHFRIQLKLYLNGKNRQIIYNIKTENISNLEMVKFLKFTKKAMTGSLIEIYSYSLHADIIKGENDPFIYETGFKDIEEEIDFYERICDLEKYCGQSINVPNVIYQIDCTKVIFISQIIRGFECVSKWNEASYTGTVNEAFRKNLLEIKDEYSQYAFVGSAPVTVFDATFDIPIMREYKCCKFKDLKKIKKELDVLKDGEQIEIELISGEDNTIIDRLPPDDFPMYNN